MLASARGCRGPISLRLSILQRCNRRGETLLIIPFLAWSPSRFELRSILSPLFVGSSSPSPRSSKNLAWEGRRNVFPLSSDSGLHPYLTAYVLTFIHRWSRRVDRGELPEEKETVDGRYVLPWVDTGFWPAVTVERLASDGELHSTSKTPTADGIDIFFFTILCSCDGDMVVSVNKRESLHDRSNHRTGLPQALDRS